MTPLAICEMCETEKETVERRRQNTAYVEEERNWITVCQECFDEVQDYWQERWEDYYRDVM